MAGHENIQQQPVSHEKMQVSIFQDSMIASASVARDIAACIRLKQERGESCVLGLATGSTPVFIYEELIRFHKQEGLSFRNVITFNLDEYYPMQPDSLQSYARFMREYLFDHIDIPDENIHIPDGTIRKESIPAWCGQYEEMIEKSGGIDIQILGIGRTGHIGFNEPGSPHASGTRLISLDHITMADAAGDFYGEENVPLHALTMGIGTIFRARRIYLLAWGETKAPIIARTVEGEISSDVPATWLQKHPDTRVILDGASSADLTRIRTPWLVHDCDWGKDRMIRKGVVWLCRKTGKPILKLTDRDYSDNGMSGLIADRGPAYNINIAVFNELQHTITGWPGGKPDTDDTERPERALPFPKRVLVFSPHPDDDVICMGGTLSRLVDQGHDVHVAYQTSGNIAVFDDDALRFAEFVSEFELEFGAVNRRSAEVHEEIRAFLRSKKPAQTDTPDVLAIKSLIRRGEARAACRFIGIPEGNIHFPDLPFYQTGQVKKKKLGKQDIMITESLLRKIRPHQVYAAGDLSDPHGTHRVCLDAVLGALESLEHEEWIKDCRVWLYRGAWQEWDPADIDMAVPLSPSELSRKRRAIFKHQSQKDRPLFPGIDTREFWQRAEARNRDTARLYDSLGMAEYEAMEAFRRLII